MDTGHSIPRFTIDLSREPRERYNALAAAYKSQIRHLTLLFDQLLADLGIPSRLHASINGVARLLLRKLNSSTETEEIRGISKVTGVPMYLLVSFNVLLDLLMGCTSGAVRSREDGESLDESRMLHFRTLDWGMDPLRAVVVQLDFIRSDSSSGREILASSITYAGFVGVLTGVRQNLSISLNFRGFHNATSKRENFRFYLHHLLVLLGIRRSISSMLRNYLFNGSIKNSSHPSPSLENLAQYVPPIHSTAAYLTFSDGNSAITIEKDFSTAVVRQSASFIVITNNDLTTNENQVNSTMSMEEHAQPNSKVAAMQTFLEESVDRRNCVVKKWKSKVRKECRRRQREADRVNSSNGRASTSQRSLRSSSQKTAVAVGSSFDTPKNDGNIAVDTQEVEKSITISQDEVISWVSAWPTTNECTHYAAVLDPCGGKVAWACRYLEPVQ